MGLDALLVQSGTGTNYFHFNPDQHSNSKPYVAPKEVGFLILSLMGGGARGWYQVCLLADLEAQCGGKAIGEVVDMIAGTSVGGILAMLLLKKDPQNLTKCQYNATWLKANFQELACKVFNYKKECLIWRIFKAVINFFWQIQHPQFSADGIEAIGIQYFGDELASNAFGHFCIPTYELGEEMRTFFVTKRNTQQGFFNGILMRVLARITSAAPTYFLPGLFNGRKFMDGGIMCNDPSLVAVETAKMVTRDKIDLITLGTGIAPSNLDVAAAQENHWGLLEEVPSLLNLFLNAQEQAVGQEIKKLSGLNTYHKAQAILSPKQLPNLSDASPEAFALMTKAAEVTMAQPGWQKIRDLVRKKASALAKAA